MSWRAGPWSGGGRSRGDPPALCLKPFSARPLANPTCRPRATRTVEQATLNAKTAPTDSSRRPSLRDSDTMHDDDAAALDSPPDANRMY